MRLLPTSLPPYPSLKRMPAPAKPLFSGKQPETSAPALVAASGQSGISDEMKQRMSHVGLDDSQALALCTFYQGQAALATATTWLAKAHALASILQIAGRNKDGSCARIADTQTKILAEGLPATHVPKSSTKLEFQVLSYTHFLDQSPRTGGFYYRPEERDKLTFDEIYERMQKSAENLGVKLQEWQETPEINDIKKALLEAGHGAIAIIPFYVHKKGHAVIAVNLQGDILLVDNSKHNAARIFTMEDYDQHLKSGKRLIEAELFKADELPPLPLSVEYFYALLTKRLNPVFETGASEK